MPAKQLTTSPTEADLEASIHHAVARAFPWLTPGSIRHQTKFSFSFGRKKIEIDGAEVSRAESRSDIILYDGERPLAVLELKRAGVPLTADDDAQGLSYARVMSPSPPLVIVTNGNDLHIVETHGGKKWVATLPTEQEFQALVANAARVAAADLRDAIDTLMGTNAAVWMQAVRHASAATLSELSASPDKPTRPFVEQILFPRRAGFKTLEHVKNGARLVLLDGAPLAGKSNVLREITVRTSALPNMAALYLEAGVGGSIFQAVADSLSNALEWQVGLEATRAWLKRLSKSTDKKLLLLVDGLAADDSDTRREVESLTSPDLGSGVAVVAALDDTVAEQLVLTPNRRGPSAIGRRAQRVTVKPLDDPEFEAAQSVLWKHRIGLMHGAGLEAELRQPWVLRAMCEPLLDALRDAEPDRGILLPPLLSLDLVQHARARFDDPNLRRWFNGIARATLAEAIDQSRDLSLKLESIDVNVLRRETLLQHITSDDLGLLIDRGFLKPAMHTSDEAVLYVRLPELLASELALLLAKELINRRKAVQDDVATWLAGAASNLPMGDVIAAQAILDAVQKPEGLSFDLIRALIDKPPQRERVRRGTRFAANFPGVGQIEIITKGGGKGEVVVRGQVHEIDIDEGSDETYGQFHPWLILSHLAGMPFIMEGDDDARRVDPFILLKIGSADIVLRAVSADRNMRRVPTHDLPGIGSIVCHAAGIIEPITLSILRYLSRDGEDHDAWIDAAIESKSMPLLARVHIALLQISSEADEDRATWASHTLETKVRPAFKFFPPLHDDEAGSVSTSKQSASGE